MALSNRNNTENTEFCQLRSNHNSQSVYKRIKVRYKGLDRCIFRTRQKIIAPYLKIAKKCKFLCVERLGFKLYNSKILNFDFVDLPIRYTIRYFLCSKSHSQRWTIKKKQNKTATHADNLDGKFFPQTLSIKVGIVFLQGLLSYWCLINICCMHERMPLIAFLCTSQLCQKSHLPFHLWLSPHWIVR